MTLLDQLKEKLNNRPDEKLSENELLYLLTKEQIEEIIQILEN